VVTDESAHRPTIDELDALPTDELKDRALATARHRGDVGFLWEIVKHLPESARFTGEDGATTGIATSFNDVLAVVEELFGHRTGDVGEMEPLLRARFIDYVTRHSG
jgi:hypothetical protein